MFSGSPSSTSRSCTAGSLFSNSTFFCSNNLTFYFFWVRFYIGSSPIPFETALNDSLLKFVLKLRSPTLISLTLVMASSLPMSPWATFLLAYSRVWSIYPSISESAFVIAFISVNIWVFSSDIVAISKNLIALTVESRAKSTNYFIKQYLLY